MKTGGERREENCEIMRWGVKVRRCSCDTDKQMLKKKKKRSANGFPFVFWGLHTLQEGAGELGVIQHVSASVETKYGNDAPLCYLHTKSSSLYAAQIGVMFSPPTVFFTMKYFFSLSLSLCGFNNSVEISELPGGSIQSQVDYVSGSEKWEDRAALSRIAAI